MLVCVCVCELGHKVIGFHEWEAHTPSHCGPYAYSMLLTTLTLSFPCPSLINSHLIGVWKLLTLHTHVKWLLMTKAFCFFMGASLLQLLALLEPARSAVCARCFIMLCYSDDLTLIKSTNHVSRDETLYGSRRSLLVLLFTHVDALGKSFSFCKYSLLCEAQDKTL